MDLIYTVVKSAKRRNLTITVERNRSVIVHAPEGTPDAKIRQIVESKRHWIYEKIGHFQKYRNRPHAPGKELVSGESALYLGRQYRIEVINTGQTEIQFDQRFFIPRAHGEERKEILRKWYIKRAKAKIIPRVKHQAKELGVTYTEARIVDNLYRWGSCTVNNNINLNWRLIKAPMFVIDYVIVHELAHLIESNHTPRFWNIIRAHAPTLEKAKAWLKENGQLLEEVI
jgi:hypothetical protein